MERTFPDSVSSKGNHAGAVWHKTDLQVHSFRDFQWKGSDQLPGGAPENETQREAWADTYVQQMLSAGLSVVAITDHHDMVAVNYVREAVARLPDPSVLCVFPGMEVTCKDDIQCILLFDPDSSSHKWNMLYGSIILGLSGSGHDPNAAKSPQVGHEGCGHPLNKFMELIDGNQDLRDAVMVLPNIGARGRHKTALRPGLGYRLSDHSFLAGYTEHHLDKYTVGDWDMISGKNAAWSQRRLSVITTGDNRNADGQDLGVNPTWIKLGERSLEGLRQAILAPDARISHELPREPALAIDSFAVSSALTGSDFQVMLNSGYNAFIGGRGSGKTSLLEYLRFGLGRALIDLDESSVTSERQRRLIEATLIAGQVEVTLSINGVKETWIREYATREKITIKRASGSVEISPEDARRRFDARSYAQKELSSLGEADQSVDRRITRLAAGDFNVRQKQIGDKLEVAKRGVKTALRNVVEFWRIEQKLQNTQRDLADVKSQIEASQTDLTEKGLSDEDQAVLDRQPKMESGKSAISELNLWDENIRGDLSAVLAQLAGPADSIWTRLDEVEISTEFKTKVVAAVATARKGLADALSAVEALNSDITATAKSFEDKSAAYDLEFDGVSQRAEANRTLIDRIKGLQAKKADLEREIENLNSRLEASKECIHALTISQSNYHIADAAFRTVLEEAAEFVAQSSGGLLQASVETPEAPENVIAALKAFGVKANMRRLDEQVIRLVGKIKLDSDRDDLDESLLRLLKLKISLGETTTLGTETIEDIRETFGFETLSPSQANSVLGNVGEENVANALTETPIPYIRFRYRDDDNYIDFADASPGQQAAALLDLLLHQKSGPLIIDQPEEDLENARIMEIATQLQSSKSDRQVIFATHNPNILVNGDADKIIALAGVGADGKSERIVIEADGSIESTALQAIITERLEGGADAFKLRAKKLNVA